MISAAFISTGRPGTSRQTRSSTPFANRVRLVSVETARAVLALTAEEIFARVEDHNRADYLPAFDLAVKNFGRSRRSLRIWAVALQKRGLATRWSLDSIIADALLTDLQGLRNPGLHLNNSQLEMAWTTANESLIRLIRTGEVKGLRVGRAWRVNRLSAAEFLKRRAL
jgi:hypothetical protein